RLQGDWSSDVCSSDLASRDSRGGEQQHGQNGEFDGRDSAHGFSSVRAHTDLRHKSDCVGGSLSWEEGGQCTHPDVKRKVASLGKIGRASCRERVKKDV